MKKIWIIFCEYWWIWFGLIPLVLLLFDFYEVALPSWIYKLECLLIIGFFWAFWKYER